MKRVDLETRLRRDQILARMIGAYFLVFAVGYSFSDEANSVIGQVKVYGSAVLAAVFAMGAVIMRALRSIASQVEG